jgi:hypothetical protein
MVLTMTEVWIAAVLILLNTVVSYNLGLTRGVKRGYKRGYRDGGFDADYAHQSNVFQQLVTETEQLGLYPHQADHCPTCGIREDHTHLQYRFVCDDPWHWGRPHCGEEDDIGDWEGEGGSCR